MTLVTGTIYSTRVSGAQGMSRALCCLVIRAVPLETRSVNYYSVGIY